MLQFIALLQRKIMFEIRVSFFEWVN